MMIIMGSIKIYMKSVYLGPDLVVGELEDEKALVLRDGRGDDPDLNV